jgi:hypothetical protein
MHQGRVCSEVGNMYSKNCYLQYILKQSRGAAIFNIRIFFCIHNSLRSFKIFTKKILFYLFLSQKWASEIVDLFLVMCVKNQLSSVSALFVYAVHFNPPPPSS